MDERNSFACGHKGLNKCAQCELGCNLLEDADKERLEFLSKKSFELYEGNSILNYFHMK